MYVTNLKKKIKVLFPAICLFFFINSCKSEINEYEKIQGNVFGTTFLVKYSDSNQRDFTSDIALLFKKFNNSLSTYHKNSVISHLNNGLTDTIVNDNFKNVVLLSKKIYSKTDGYFDPTVGKMVNAWGFGPIKRQTKPTNMEVDSLMQYVGFEKIEIDGNHLTKQNAAVFLDFNAIAKGYGVDVIANFLESNDVKDYLIEIGGEVKVKGKNNRGLNWVIGIENPNFDGTRSLQKKIRLNNEVMATSGNYRKFKTDSLTGKKIAHTLNPKTGFPAKTDLLSASVIAPVSCAEVDAYATAFMAMGFEKAKKLNEAQLKMKVFFVYLDQDKLKTYASPNIKFLD